MEETTVFDAMERFDRIALAVAFKPIHVALFYALISTWNKAGRPETFEQWADQTCHRAGKCSLNTLASARNKLIQEGIIFYAKSGQRGVPRYSFNALFDLECPDCLLTLYSQDLRVSQFYSQDLRVSREYSRSKTGVNRESYKEEEKEEEEDVGPRRQKPPPDPPSPPPKNRPTLAQFVARCETALIPRDLAEAGFRQWEAWNWRRRSGDGEPLGRNWPSVCSAAYVEMYRKCADAEASLKTLNGRTNGTPRPEPPRELWAHRLTSPPDSFWKLPASEQERVAEQETGLLAWIRENLK